MERTREMDWTLCALSYQDARAKSSKPRWPDTVKRMSVCCRTSGSMGADSLARQAPPVHCQDRHSRSRALAAEPTPGCGLQTIPSTLSPDGLDPTHRAKGTRRGVRPRRCGARRRAPTRPPAASVAGGQLSREDGVHGPPRSQARRPASALRGDPFRDQRRIPLSSSRGGGDCSLRPGPRLSRRDATHAQGARSLRSQRGWGRRSDPQFRRYGAHARTRCRATRRSRLAGEVQLPHQPATRELSPAR